MDRQAIRERQAQWSRFHEWERRRLDVSRDLNAAWHWYEETWQLARQTGAIPATAELDLDKVRRLQRVRATLAHLQWPK